MTLDVSMLAWAALVMAYYVGRIGEVRMDRINTRYLVLAGAVEGLPVLMAIYYRLILVLLPLAVLERRWMSPQVAPIIMTLAVVMVILGGAMRLWAIRSLGWQWSMRCLVHPTAPVQKKGPYRWMNHPEYVSRLVDGAGLAVFIGAYWTAFGYIVINLLVLWPVISTEKRLMAEAAARAATQNV